MADRILREAFDRFTGVDDLFGSREYVRSRWRARPRSAIAAEVAGALAGSNFVTDWGSLGFFGPLSVRPELWDRGVGKALMESTLDLLSAVGIRQAGLFTFPQSAKHVGLYQRFGFWPQFLTCILVKEPSGARQDGTGSHFSALGSVEQEAFLRACRELTTSLFDGLDVSREIQAIDALGLGDTILVCGGSRLEAFALCHAGPNSEAGSGGCYVKFAAAAPAGHPDLAFARLLDACEAFAVNRGANRLEIGVSTACHRAYRALLARGYRSDLQGIAMTRPNAPAYHRSEFYVLGDWR